MTHLASRAMAKAMKSGKLALLAALLFCVACETTAPDQLHIGTSEILFGYIGLPYEGRFSGHGAMGPYEWSLIKGGVPGLTLSANGDLTGTPTEEGEWPMTIEVRADDRRGTRELTILIRGNPPTILPDTLPHATVGVLYEVELRLQGGLSNSLRRGWSVSSGGLPAGIGIASRTPPPAPSYQGPYYLQGVPQAVGISYFTLRTTRGIDTPIDTAYRAYRLMVVPQ